MSYAREDEQLILPVVHLLRAAGAVVFFDQEDISYGDRWESVLLEQLRASERILVFWSANATKSEWVRWEYLTAIGAGLRVVPIPLDATPLSEELAMFQALTALVPLMHQARRGLAPRIARGPWRKPRRLWTSVALMMLLFSILSMMLVRAPAESAVSTPLLGTGVWLLGVLALSAFISVLAFKRAKPVAERAGQDLQAAVYAVVFGHNVNADGA
jgi:hypothetical protein